MRRSSSSGITEAVAEAEGLAELLGRLTVEHMGFDTKAVQFLLAVRALGVSFDRTATIGRQRLFVTPSSLYRCLRRFGFDVDRRRTARLLSESGGFAESFLRLLGATDVVSIDASGYEGASRVVDLNKPVPADLDRSFTVVIDAGSLEHVFDFPTAVRNCMRMVAVDGHFLGVTVANNMAGHGFYQFSPELFYRVFTRRNGFRIERMLVTETSSKRWFDVRDPAVVRSRVQLRTFRPAYLCILGNRVADGAIFATPPQQSDYVSKWHSDGAAGGCAAGRPASHREIRARRGGACVQEPVSPCAGHHVAVRRPCVQAGRHLQVEAARRSRCGLTASADTKSCVLVYCLVLL